ncbi:TPA-induced transmembrane protein-like isoform X2 [Megalops cyprinoides]|uniref:TPA-induced transmembrane protein-like isoform X2 n=1 Tax=Megalops cyprinoides TaxID=118141 RepID=UPI00186407DF|nr:TPA-induced transmembrane protein-like isoform X2 [Megalops cyprinoides]
MSDMIEFEVITSTEHNSQDEGEHFANTQVTGSNTDHSARDSNEAAEECHHLLQEQVVASNRGPHSCGSASVNSQDADTRAGSDWEHRETGPVRRCRCSHCLPDLNTVVLWRIRLWMVVLLLFVVIATVIVLSLVFCSVPHDDEDDKFDRESFTVPRYYSGTLRLVNQNFTAELLSLKSPQSQVLSGQLEVKLSDLFSSSPALGRYFSAAGMSSFSNGSVTASYWLKFLMPQEHAQLVRYTLSREMVYSVLQQHLHDQEPRPWDPLYIDPVSVDLKVGYSTLEAQ